MAKDFYYDKMKQFLTDEPLARERAKKNRATAYLLFQKYPKVEVLGADLMELIVKDANSYDRAWRAVTERNKALRGTDYGEKKKLEEEKKVELGYGSSLYQDVIKKDD